MSFNVSEFRSHINQGLAKPFNFRVLFSGALFRSSKIEAMSFLCNQATLPGRAFNASDVRTWGPKRRQPNLSVYDDMSMMFYCRNDDLFPRPLFEEWQNAIIETTTGNIGYFNNYVSDIEIEQFDETGDTIYTIKLIDAYPIIVAPLALDWSAQNTPHNLNVSFAFRKWYEQPIPMMPFGNNMLVNQLWPGLDLGGFVDKHAAAILHGDGGQIIRRWERGQTLFESFENIRTSG